jgi:predicted DCC family thiol-disulfide oxidoreductase YuxK
MGEEGVKPSVYFDGGCPLCRREIQAYQRADGADAYAWVDASQCSPEQLGDGLRRPEALAVLHVRQADGRLLLGVDAFIAIWQGLPQWRWLARVAGLPGVKSALKIGYALFLRLRPLWRR